MKTRCMPLIALAILSLAVITGCATAAHQDQPSDVALRHAPASSGLESMPPMPREVTAPNGERTSTPPHDPVVGVGVDAPTDLPPPQQDVSAIDHLFDFVQRDFQAVTDMAGAANPVDQLGKDCGTAVVSAIGASRKNLGTDTHVVGLASAAERLRLAERSLVFYMPVYLEARDRCRAAGIDLKAALAGVLKFAPGLKGVL